jgi:hypothetical protein
MQASTADDCPQWLQEPEEISSAPLTDYGLWLEKDWIENMHIHVTTCLL